MKKRRTKEQREAAEKEAMLQRVRDVLIGAREWTDRFDPISAKGAGALLQWLAEHIGVSGLTEAAAHRNAHLFGWWTLDEFKSAVDLVDFWHRQGVRA